MSNVIPYPGGKRCIVCADQIHPDRVRENPDLVTCDAGCRVEREAAGGKRDTLVIHN